MPPSADEQLAALTQTVGSLELLCNELELGLRERDWPRIDRAIADSRRTMHEFENAMGETTGVRTAEFDREIFARLQRVYAVRDDQMKRLATIHEEIGENLRALSRWKGYARSIGGGDHTRPPRLLNDLR